ncbi:MAG: RimK family alpha-L-glutamate ligase [Deltaproteobacteria bacterium HGW-Deltaproteobacteria-21]|nr:MAG: RimK family alpha-L-glutamate ligase [Deltaproteobacteria bacterium HGW-Deltaproteobacteria-21]
MNITTLKIPFVALGSRMKGVPEVCTLGVKPNFCDYTSHEKTLMMDASFILYPTLNYAQFFHTLGKALFPSLETYLYSDEKIKQTTLFNMLHLSHPRTRFYYHLHHDEILGDFSFPFIAKLPRASARGRGVFKIQNPEELDRYLRRTNVAYVQEYLPHDKDLRVILINYEPVLAYWRIRCSKDFRTNLFQGGTIDFKGIPHEGLETARTVARKCRFNDAGLDLIHSGGKWYVIEANMNYGREGLKSKGLDLKRILRGMLLSGALTCESEAKPLVEVG